jgi:hypothetical protein
MIHMEAVVSSNMLANIYTALKPRYEITFTTPFSVPSCCSRLRPVFCISLSLCLIFKAFRLAQGPTQLPIPLGGLKCI